VAGGEIPAITMNGAAIAVGDFVAVQRQSVASYVLNPASGAIWVPLAATSGPYAGFLLAWRVTPGGQQSLYTTTLAWGSGDAMTTAKGSDGNAWMTTGGGSNYIAQITASGSVAIWPLQNSAPQGICTGSDGNLWVADLLQGGVWRVPPKDPTAATFMPVAQGAAEPYSIAPGPDGRVWFTDSAYELVYAMATDGAYQSFATGGFSSGLLGIAPGPADSMWVCDEYLNGLWQVTMGGTVTFHSLTVPSPYPPINTLSRLVTDANGLIWITDTEQRVLTYSQSGQVGVVPLTQSATAFGVCIGPDGNVWVAANPPESGTPVPLLFGIRDGAVFAAYAAPADVAGSTVGDIASGP
jgi:virginiamycin B lyase